EDGIRDFHVTGVQTCALPIFALLSVTTIWLGHAFKTQATNLTVMWPATGLLLAALILAPHARWPVLIAVQLAAEYGVALLVDEQIGRASCRASGAMQQAGGAR